MSRVWLGTLVFGEWMNSVIHIYTLSTTCREVGRKEIESLGLRTVDKYVKNSYDSPRIRARSLGWNSNDSLDVSLPMFFATLHVSVGLSVPLIPTIVNQAW